MWFMIFTLLSAANASTLDDTATMADTLLSNTELIDPAANILQCSAVTSGDDSYKQILKKSLAKTTDFFAVTTIDKCQGLTIYLDDKAQRRAIGYYSANGAIRTFDRACAAGTTDADCRSALQKISMLLKPPQLLQRSRKPQPLFSLSRLIILLSPLTRASPWRKFLPMLSCRGTLVRMEV